MRFGFTDEQLELRRGVRQVVERECTPADVRAAYAAAGGTPGRKRWGVLAALGVPGILVPEHAGGLGLDEVDLIGALEEAGRVALPEPVGVSAGVAAPVLAALLDGVPPAPDDDRAPGTPAAHTTARAAERTAERTAGQALAGHWLERLASGSGIVVVGGVQATPEEIRITTAPAETGTAGSAPASGGTGAPTAGDPAAVQTPLVVAAEWADALVLAVETANPAVGAAGPEVHLVPADRCHRTPVPALDPTRHLATVTWTPTAATCVASGVDAERCVAEIAQRTALVQAAELLGLADAMIDQATAYARTRQQFGKPIGSFQAVKHHLANARVRLEFARPAVYRAAWSMRHQPSGRDHDCSMALAMAADAGELAARVALQVHGAIGYTWECDLHLWMKRAWALSASGQAAPVHRARVLRAALAQAPARQRHGCA